MVVDDDMPDGWSVWHEETDGRLVLTFRPDVFDGQSFSPACIPTIFVSNGPHRHRRPEQRLEGYSSPWWFVTLYMEPEVILEEAKVDSRDDAVAEALETARRFSSGSLDYRSAYQVPREEYLDRLDELLLRDA